MKTTRLLLALLLFTAADLSAANVKSQQRFDQKWTLSPGGSLVLNNPFGSIEIIGTDSPDVTAVVLKTIIGVDQAALNEGADKTELRVGGDERTRVITTILPQARSPRWSSTVDYQLKVPKSVHVSIGASTTGRIRVASIRGNVQVKTFNGLVQLENIGGAATVENTNGGIVYSTTVPAANARLTTLNGNIQLIVDQGANFRWIADSLTGDFRSTMPVRGQLVGTTFRGSVNEPGGPTIETSTMMGNVFLLARGTVPKQAQALRDMPPTIIQTSASAPPPMQQQAIRQDVHQGRFTYNATIGDVRVSEVRGDAFIKTGAGEVHLGAVFGMCNVQSGGGPLHLGEIHRQLVARTAAGDILVDAARQGGTLGTEGGIIRVLYSGGPMTLKSGGGDITVRQAAGEISAETRSGDINITMDPVARAKSVEAKTAKGNVVFTIHPRFAADVEATIVTSTPNVHSVKSDFPGLSIQREQLPGGKTRIRATGKINGGGEKLELTAEDGGIQIISKATSPVSVNR